MTVTTTRLPLATGARIPQIGLGVWQSPRGAPTRDAVTAALELGYRHVDTARIYQNEADVGAAVKARPVPRARTRVRRRQGEGDRRQQLPRAAPARGARPREGGAARQPDRADAVP